jgi:hypothetical protein
LAKTFRGDPQLVGKPITIDGNSVTVIGIAPAGFQYPDKTESGCRRTGSLQR